jgi:hypothetical protein
MRSRKGAAAEGINLFLQYRKKRVRSVEHRQKVRSMVSPVVEITKEEEERDEYGDDTSEGLSIQAQ